MLTMSLAYVVVGSGKELVLDPTGDEVARSAGAGSMTMAMMPARGEVTQLSHVGDWQPKLYEVSLSLSQ